MVLFMLFIIFLFVRFAVPSIIVWCRCKFFSTCSMGHYWCIITFENTSICWLIWTWLTLLLGGGCC
ncbi:hypothetical protein C2G38_2100384 [Gigaspora rosea]|uniref:Uncharacterized protein n=1 Tax=Gigaspora rosea TaxID=44941 RepID=A0A397UR19_9GLOM|nr:hypothetical protein C2G38_2100384 [Gigaspora rosea]